jgi:hypothetical protein
LSKISISSGDPAELFAGRTVVYKTTNISNHSASFSCMALYHL